MFKMSFGQRFKSLRLEKGFTQEALVEDFYRVTNVAMTKSAVSNYERDQRVPEIPLLRLIADYFDVTVDYLLGRSENKKGLIESADRSRELSNTMKFLKVHPNVKMMVDSFSTMSDEEVEAVIAAVSMLQKTFKKE